jgi:hypothetical protein
MLLRLALILSCLFFAILPAEAKRVAILQPAAQDNG